MSETLVQRPPDAERRASPNAPGARIPAGLDLIPHRALVEHTVDAWLPLRPGDRARVSPGDAVTLGAPLAERLRLPKIVEVPARFGGRPGERWARTVASGASSNRRDPHPAGELLFESNGRWRIVAAEHHDIIESPLAGIVREVRPGIGLSIRAAGAALGGVLALGDPTHGRLEIATDADGELRPRSLDVGSAGAILVVGARIDAEALTRARAMGIRGIIVATLPGKDRRDFLASEGRQRAGLHRLPPFGVVVLHGSQRRPIATAAMGLLQRLAGKEVAILGGPPSVVFDPAGVVLEPDPPGTVHVRSGPLAGRTGRWAGLAGPRRFPGGLHLEAGFVRFGDEWPVPIPLADLERLV